MKQPHDRLLEKMRQRHQQPPPPPAKPNALQLVATAKLEKIKEMWEKDSGLFLNARDTDHDNGNILHVAIRLGREDIAGFLATQAPKLVNGTKNGGHTPLYDAVHAGISTDTIQTMLKSGANLKESASEGKTLMHEAVSSGRDELLPVFVAAGLDVNARDKRGITPLIQAVKRGSVDTAKTLLDLKADATAQEENGYSPLHISLWHNNQDMIDLLLNRKEVLLSLNEDKSKQDGYTPLMVAVTHSNYETVKRLVDLGANINDKDKTGKNAVALVLYNNKFENDIAQIMDYLLSKGSDIPRNVPGQIAPRYNNRGSYDPRDGYRPINDNFNNNTGAENGMPSNPDYMLHKLIEEDGSIDLIRKLLDGGMEIEETNRMGATPLGVAVEKMRYKVTQLLLDYGAKTENPDMTRSLVSIVAQQEETPKTLKMLKLLHRHGAALDGKTTSNNTSPLMRAVSSNNIETCRYLLENGVDVNALSSDFATETPFIAACNKKHYKLAKMLRDFGADINAKNGKGNSAMHLAAVSGDVETLKFLVGLGAKTDEKNEESKTPLVQAFNAYSNSAEATIYLAKQNGRDFNSPDENGRTLLHMAAEAGKTDFLEKVLDSKDGKDIDLDVRDYEGRTPLMLAAYEGKSAFVDLLAEKGAPLNSTDNFGRTALYFAVAATEENTIDSLIKKGANLHILPKTDRRSFLHQAAETARVSLTKKFVEAKLPVNRKDVNGNTPLHIAIKHGNEPVIEYLLEHGADPKITNSVGFTAVDLAEQRNHYQITNLVKAYAEGKPPPKRDRYYDDGYRSRRDYW
ncbi:MAG: hypothetical protein EP349_08870 [Alphaproteobacteria bacterium]|nr:MAG: hypothetical protein EP349_08870 [Alphaproteobacteria bacterium]